MGHTLNPLTISPRIMNHNTHTMTRSLALIPLLLALQAKAHISYAGRDFGTVAPQGETKSTTLSGSVSSLFGWAYAGDADLGDSHRSRAFRVSVLTPGDVTITVQRTGTASDGSANLLLPALSIFSGLAHLPPEKLAHDGSAITQLELTSLYGAGNFQGSYRSLENWFIGNDPHDADADASNGISDPASLRHFTYIDHAADGTSANYGTITTRPVGGDGAADGFVSKTFKLEAGDYTIMVGGAEYLTTPPAAPYTNYPVNVTLSVIPEASSTAMVICAALGLACRRKRHA